MSYRRLISCLVLSVGALLVAEGVASAVQVPVTFNMTSGNDSSNSVTISGAVNIGYGYSTHTSSGVSYVHGDIPTTLTLDPSSHAITNVAFSYNKPGTLSFSNVALNYKWTFLGSTVETASANTYNLQGTFFTPTVAGGGPVTPSGTIGVVNSNGSFAFSNHGAEINNGTYVMSASGVSDFNSTEDCAVSPNNTNYNNSTGGYGVVPSGSGQFTTTLSNPYNISISSAGYSETFDYTVKLAVPLNYSQTTNESGITSTVTIAGTSGPLTTLNKTFSQTFNYLPGDANLDGVVDATDLNTVLSYYNQGSGSNKWVRGDFDGSGITDATDLNTVLSYYNQHSAGLMSGLSAATVPEPGTIVMLLSLVLSLAGFGLWKRSR